MSFSEKGIAVLLGPLVAITALIGLAGFKAGDATPGVVMSISAHEGPAIYAYDLTVDHAQTRPTEGLGDTSSPVASHGERATNLGTPPPPILVRLAAETEGAGGGRIFTHFTDEAGATGITGTGPLSVGETSQIGQLSFAKGENSFLASGEGRNFVTDLGPDASPRQLEGIGVFGPKQQYAIQFAEGDAFASGARVIGEAPSRGIYSIPGPCEIFGICTVTRVR